MRFVPAVRVPEAIPSNAKWLVCAENAVLLKTAGTGLEQVLNTADVDQLEIARAEPVMIGTLDDAPVLAVSLEKRIKVDGFDVAGLRTLWSRLDEQLFAIAGRANQLVQFASTHRFCGRCGTKTTPHERERAFVCPNCSLSQYPRISPAIITLVRKGAQGLLANSGRFPIPMFSTLAGFAEVGESLEETLAREVREEVGIEVTNIRYFGSQPWPFPHSLMIGFTADYAGGEIAVDGDEIKEAKFFDATDLPMIPPRLSIARQLIDGWVKEVTGAPAKE